MDFLDAKLEDYITEHTQNEPEVLKKLNRETHAKVLVPRMLSGHLQGRVLSMLAHMIKPERVLEIGTYTGYSAICFAEGLAANGKIITIDINEELEAMARRYFKEAGVDSKIDFQIGNALDIIPTLKETLDLVFIDADKENYSNYYDLVFEKVRKGGYIIADNVLWSGKVLMDEAQMDKDTMAIDAYNKKIQSDPRVENVLFPIRDGLMLARKL
ncbi:MAG: class I SAM-dependent methyltransferase [Bacteroidetes bacterium]|nr:class I SAM-dependent methyltransferase [Bacteroidota bacterium]